MWVVVSTRLENATFDLNLAWYDRHRKLQHKKFKNVEAPIIKKPFGDGLYMFIPPIYGDFADGLPHGSVFGRVSQGQLCCPRKRARTAEAKVRVP